MNPAEIEAALQATPALIGKLAPILADVQKLIQDINGVVAQAKAAGQLPGA